MKPLSFLGLALLAATGLAACDARSPRNMSTQPKLKTGSATTLFADGLATRPPPPHTIAAATGDRAAESGGRTGGDEVARLDAADAQRALPVPLDAALLARGRERYAIYCLPCHGRSGEGDGAVVQRGFPAPQSLREPRLRAVSDRHLFDVVTGGYGVMLPLADRIDSADRWAIVAAVRGLQQQPGVPIEPTAPAAAEMADGERSAPARPGP